MASRIVRFLAALAVAVIATVATGGAAGSQVTPPALPPLPPLPPQLGPVLLVGGPIAAPVCGNASSLAIAASGLVPAAGSLLGFIAAPVFVVCANVPVPESSSELICAQDDQVLAALSTVTFAVIGSGAPVAMRLVGPVVESVTVLEAMSPDAVRALGGAELLSGAFACRPAHPVTPAPTAAVVNPPAASASDMLPDLALGDDNFGFAGGGEIPGGGRITDDANPRALPPARAVAAARPFDYPLVFVVPLLLLTVGGYLARSLTEDVRLPS